MKLFLTGILLFVTMGASSQQFMQTTPAAQRWVDSTFTKLKKNQKIAQLMVMRMSERRGAGVYFYEKEVSEAIKKYNIGSICLFQGKAGQQAAVINNLQALAKTPVLVCVDGETGVGMRFADIKPLPDQLTVGAVADAAIAYKLGKAIGEQCKRIGIQVDYAPVVDVNNNPDNPVINFRSFGEDKYKVALLGTQLMKGMQDAGVMACAKHFPGHGDVAVDSHLDLPVINKSKTQLQDLELYPFQELIREGVGSVMVAHLSIPAIDNTPNQASSLSKKNVTDLLRNEMGFKGLTFTDALEMKGVTKFYPQGEAAVQSIVAGNDMLCLPGDIKNSIKAVRNAIRKDLLSWADIDVKTKRVLLAKYNLGLQKPAVIDSVNLVSDLNSQVLPLKKEVYEHAITLLRQTDLDILPLTTGKKIAYVGIGINTANNFARQLVQNFQADTYFFDYTADTVAARIILNSLKAKYETVIVGLHQFKKYPANNFGISTAAVSLLQKIQNQPNTISFVFGNPYAVKNFGDARNLVACYDDDPLMQDVALQYLQGTLTPTGKLPVTVNQLFPYGMGITIAPYLPLVKPETLGFDLKKLSKIDSIAQNAIQKGATPGCVVLVAKDGKVGYYKAYGNLEYNGKQPVSLGTVYDLALVTKITATTVAVMKLYEEGRLNLDKTLGDYLSWTRGTDKAPLKMRDILLHQAGLVSFIPFYRETIDAPAPTGKPLPGFYKANPDARFNIRVADNMYMRRDWADTINKRIVKSKLGKPNNYIYSDNDFIFLGKIVEQITKKALDEYVRETFYLPLGMTSTNFKPLEHGTISNIAPTEHEKHFRSQLIRGDVHDPGAAMLGGVAGHAGLFSNAYDLAKLYQLLLNGGEINGIRLFKKETIDYFTAYHSDISRRGLGFDKPEKDNATRKTPYPALSVSPETYGHTGFTGIGVWADPKYNLLYIFLSNRVNPDGNNNILLNMNVRGNIQEAVYQSFVKPETVKKEVVKANPAVRPKLVKKK